ncbi:hypothetical protein BGX34_008323 [Mortierella sp. NVP85]|nr:hypothetical protein BGX34_008323 [Mortierella sp. NVP85]
MVKLTLSITVMAAALASVVTAAPLCEGSMRVFSNYAHRSDCLPTTSVREYQPFKIQSVKLDRLLAKEFGSNLVLGSGSPEETLSVCVVTGDGPCDRQPPPYCIRQNVNYRIRVEKPIRGYLMVQEEDLVVITHDIGQASDFQMYDDDELRIVYLNPKDEPLAITTNGQSAPVTLRKPEKDIKQSFQLLPTNYY